MSFPCMRDDLTQTDGRTQHQVSAATALPHRANFLQRGGKLCAGAADPQMLEPRARARNETDVAPGNAQRFGDELHQRRAAARTRTFSTLRPSASCATPSMASRPPRGVSRTVTTTLSAVAVHGRAMIKLRTRWGGYRARCSSE